MKCQACGTPIQPNASFCPSCGASVAVQAPSSSGGNRVLKKVGASKLQFFSQIACIVLLLIAFVFILTDYIMLKSELDSSWFVSERESATLTMLGMYVVVLLALVIIVLLKTIVMHKMSVCVCEHTVSGIGGKNLFFNSDPFEFSYDEIISVKTGLSNKLIIEARSKTCKCQVADHKAVCQMIQERMRANRY